MQKANGQPRAQRRTITATSITPMLDRPTRSRLSREVRARTWWLNLKGTKMIFIRQHKCWWCQDMKTLLEKKIGSPRKVVTIHHVKSEKLVDLLNGTNPPCSCCFPYLRNKNSELRFYPRGWRGVGQKDVCDEVALSREKFRTFRVESAGGTRELKTETWRQVLWSTVGVGGGVEMALARSSGGRIRAICVPRLK